ncbi:MAG TPA: hypothetical protein PLO23_05750 [Alphaproteobacteria bacterium]|nr:hypothetical protein [Alphaproteobacteria bacterium]
MDKSTVKNWIAGGIVVTGIVGTWMAATKDDTPSPDQPELGLDYSDKSLDGRLPLMGSPEFIPPMPRLHDHDGRIISPFDPLDAPPPAPSLFAVPEFLQGVFAGASVGNVNIVEFTQDGALVRSVKMGVRVANLDCNAARKVFEAKLKESELALTAPDDAEALETVAKQLFQTGTLEILDFHLNRDELPPELSGASEAEKEELLSMQKMLWPAEWPEQVDINIRLECRSDTFGHDM